MLKHRDKLNTYNSKKMTNQNVFGYIKSVIKNQNHFIWNINYITHLSYVV